MSAPVEITYLGMTDSSIRYRITVRTDKPIEQVDLHVDYLDAGGGSMLDSTLTWQNVVGDQRRPIVAGQSYEADDYLLPDTAKCVCRLERVVFTDQSTWEPPA